MTAEAAPPVVASGATVHEFTADLVLRGRATAAEGVVSIEFADPRGGDLPSWEPGAHIDLLLTDGLIRQYSLCGDPADAGSGGSAFCLIRRAAGGSRFVHENLVEGPPFEFAVRATTFSSSSRRDTCSSPVESGSLRSWR